MTTTPSIDELDMILGLIHLDINQMTQPPYTEDNRPVTRSIIVGQDKAKLALEAWKDKEVVKELQPWVEDMETVFGKTIYLAKMKERIAELEAGE